MRRKALKQRSNPFRLPSRSAFLLTQTVLVPLPVTQLLEEEHRFSILSFQECIWPQQRGWAGQALSKHLFASGHLFCKPPLWLTIQSFPFWITMSMASGSHSMSVGLDIPFFILNLLCFLLFNPPWFNVLMDFLKICIKTRYR